MKVKALLKTGKMFCKKHAPEILLGTGIAAGVAGTVVACKQTTKLKETIEPCKDELVDIRSRAEEDAEFQKKEYPVALAKNYAKTAGKVTLLYSPAIALEAVGIASVLCGHKILKGRYAAMSAAYLGCSAAFNQYRSRVKNELGEDMDHHFRFGTDMKQIEVEETDENGKTKKVKKNVETVDENALNAPSPYAMVFDASNPNWSPYPEYNQTFFNLLQAQFTDRLAVEGFLFLNDVLDALGFDKTLEGQCMGWIYDPDDPNKACYVDFGCFNAAEQHNRALLNGYEPSIILDFNVDSNVLLEWSHDKSRKKGGK